MRKSNDGFTLVELLVGILCAAIVTGAAMTLMLMGARTNRALLDANSEQSTARIITTMVETLASEGSIKTVVTVGDDGWALLNKDGNTVLSYSNNTVYSTGNAVLMEDVSESSVTLSDEGTTITGCLLNFSLTADESTYKTSVFCRTADVGENILNSDDLPKDPDASSDEDVSISMSTTEENGRFKLLEILCSQYGSTGKIMGTPDPSGYEYYSEWYIKDLNYEDSGWSETTPWCACFVSWGIAQITNDYLNSSLTPIRFAHVESGAKIFKDLHLWQDPASYLPSAGDLVFFDFYDWDNDPGDAAPSSLDHVGVVFYCDNNYLYTIEGNTSADSNGVGRVDLKRYALNDTNIIGYGVLNWK